MEFLILVVKKKKLIGTVSQKLACALIALSSFILLKPIGVFVNLL